MQMNIWRTGNLQMIIQRIGPLTNDHPSPPSPKSPVAGSRFNLVDLSRTICSCCKNFSLSLLDIGNSYTFFFSVRQSTAARLISFSIVGSVWLRWGGVGVAGWADGGKLEALYNKPTTDLHPHVFLSDSQPWLGNLENQLWQLFCHLKEV